MTIGRRHLVIGAVWLTLASSIGRTVLPAMAEEAIDMVPMIDGEVVEDRPLRLDAGKTSRLGVRISDARRGFPLGDLHPALWIRPAIEGRSACAAAVDRYLSLGPNAGLDIDLNGYLLATLNRDHSIGVMDPRLDLATSNLMSLTPRSHAASAWWLDQTGARLFTASADAGRVEVVDLLSGTLQTIVDDLDGAGSMAVFPGIDRLWVAGDHEFVALSLSSLELMSRTEADEGNWQLEADGPGLRLLALERDGARFDIIHPGSGIVERSLDLDGPRGMFVHDAKADAVYLIGEDGVSIERLFLDRGEPRSVPLPVSIDRLLITPDNARLAGLDTETGALILIDPAQLRSTHVLAFDGRPDQIHASDDYLYLRERQTGYVSLIHLPSLDEEKEPGVLRIPIGRSSATAPLGFGEGETAPAAIVPFIDGGGVIIASPSDKKLYLYRETGMQAPSNVFRAWTAPPEALAILDRRPRERKAGVYETAVHPKAAGAFELVFYLPTPKIIRCLPVVIDGEGEDLAETLRPPKLVWNEVATPIIAGDPAALDFQLERSDDGRPIDGAGVMEVMIVASGSNWHWRGRALPTEDRRFTVSFVLPKPGSYQVLVRAPERHLDFRDQQPLTIEATAGK